MTPLTVDLSSVFDLDAFLLTETIDGAIKSTLWPSLRSRFTRRRGMNGFR